MLKSSRRFHSLAVPLLTWLVLLIPFAFYQRYYVSSQQAYLTQHGFRLLSAVGRQLNSYIDSVNKTVSAAQKTDQKPAGKVDPVEDYLKKALPDLDIAPEDFVVEKEGTAAKSLSVEFGPRPAAFQRTFKVQFTGRVSLDSAIRERLKGIGEDYFDDVLIANPQGQVLFQRSADTRIASLDYLARVAAENADVAAGRAAKQPADGKANPEPAPGSSFAALSESSNVLQIKLGGADYKLFLQPLLLLPSESGVRDKLVVCGLWRTERLESSSFALPYSYVIWFALFCVTAGSFSWPFLKINYMSHAERLRRSHGWLLALSMFLGTASVTLMVLNASYSFYSEGRVDEDLHRLALQIQQNVDTELRLALSQLTNLSNEPAVLERAANKDDQAKANFLAHRQDLAYPYFEIAFWADGDGKQLVKDTVDLYPTPRTPVKNFPYFQDVMRQIGPAGPPAVPVLAQLDDRLYSIEPRISPNTGQFHAVIATEFHTDADAKKEIPKTDKIPKPDIRVQVLVTNPLSLVNPVLPPDFGFAVVASDGTVLFHSNPLRNLSENFISECKDTEALQAALFSNSDQKLDLAYSGTEQRALVTKISHLGPEPTTLIVFHNSDINLTINMAIILIGSVLMALYTGVIVLVAIIDLLRGSKHPPKSIWPRPECSVRYVLIFSANSFLVLLFLVLYPRLWEVNLLALIAGILVLAISCTAVFIGKERLPAALEKWNQTLKQRFRLAYVAAAVSILAVMTVVPSFGFFKFAHDAASEIAAKHGQLRTLNAVLQRRERISSYYHRLNAPQTLAGSQIREILDRYDLTELGFLSFAPHLDKTHSLHDTAFQKAFDELLVYAARWFPSNEFGSEMHMLTFASLEDDASASPVTWSELAENMFRLEWRGDGDVDPIDSQFAEWAGVTGAGWMSLGLLCLLVGGWFFLLMKNIFLAVSQNPAPFEQVNWRSCEAITANFLVLGDPRSGKSGWLSQLPGIRYFDLRIALDPTAMTAYSQDSVVALDHFDFNLANRADNQVRLQLLERLVYRDRCRVVIVSSIDPVFYLSEGASRILADTPQLAAESLERWTRVMSAFQKVNFQDPHKPAFDELVNRPGLQSTPLIQWIKEECRHTGYLRAFGMLLYQRHQPAKPGDPAPPFDAQTALGELVEYTDSYYSVLWSTLSAREHLVLYQLAKDGWANLKNDRAIRQLQRKGLIHSSPMLRIMNESFRLFVLKSQDQREIAEWEQQGEQSSWRSLKIVFIATAVGLAAWLFYAQKDLFQVSIGYVVTIGAAITAIANALSGIKGRMGSAAKSP